MRSATLAVSLAVVLSATGFAAITSDRGVIHYSDTPSRAHSAIGPVQILAAPPEDVDPISLADAARAQYGDIDALADVRTAPLPYADGAILTGTAVRWD